MIKWMLCVYPIFSPVKFPMTTICLIYHRERQCSRTSRHSLSNLSSFLFFFRVATTSIPVSFLAASSDCRQSIDLVIALIADHEVANSLSSLAQIDEVLNDANKCVYLEQHVDKLLRMLSMKLRIAQQSHLYDSSLSSESVERLFRGILSVLLDLFSRSHLAKLATRDTLKEVLNVLLPFVVVTITPTGTTSVNPAARIDASSNEDFIRIVNVIVLKILQHAHITNVLTALIRLLTECCLQNDFSVNDPFVKLVLKVTRQSNITLPRSCVSLIVSSVTIDSYECFRWP